MANKLEISVARKVKAIFVFSLTCLMASLVIGASDWQKKIDVQVLQDAASGQTEFLLLFADQGDVSGAKTLKTKREKGAYVFTCLTNRAAHVQQPTLEVLRARGLQYRPFWIANMVWVKGDMAALQMLSARAEVARVLPNPSVQLSHPLSPRMVSTNAAGAVEWNIAKVGAPAVWALGYTGKGVVVGGQDTGYDWTHPALMTHYRGWTVESTNHDYNWHDAIHTNDVHNTGQNPLGYDLAAPADDQAHGTHTMGIMVGDDRVGNQIGMAPEAKWIGCRNMERGWGTPAGYVECFQWFLAPTDINNANPDPSKAPDVINNSWSCPAEEGCFDPLVFETLVRNLRAAGIVVVVSAGNSGPACSTIREAPEPYDASFDVGATDINDVIADFSSRGPVFVGTNLLLKPNVCAPGVDIRSCIPGGLYAGGWSGTSMAGPHAAGLVALLLSAHQELAGQVDAIERIIEQTAIPLTNSESCGGIPGTQIPNTAYGWGRIDALGALALGDGDNDGIPDWWEIWHNLDRFNPVDAALDPDGDGVSNLDEYLAGTDPGDRLSYFYIKSVTCAPQPALTFQSSLNCFYTLLSRTDLFQGNWLSVPGQAHIPGTGADLSLIDTNGLSEVIRFYRVAVGR